MAEKNGIAKRFENGELLLWLVCSVFQQYGMGMESDILNQGQFKFMLNWSLMNPKDFNTNILKMCEGMSMAIKHRIAAGAPPGWTVNFGSSM
jgi:hypothetical protein